MYCISLGVRLADKKYRSYTCKRLGAYGRRATLQSGHLLPGFWGRKKVTAVVGTMTGMSRLSLIHLVFHVLNWNQGPLRATTVNALKNLLWFIVGIVVSVTHAYIRVLFLERYPNLCAHVCAAIPDSIPTTNQSATRQQPLVQLSYAPLTSRAV